MATPNYGYEKRQKELAKKKKKEEKLRDKAQRKLSPSSRCATASSSIASTRKRRPGSTSGPCGGACHPGPLPGSAGARCGGGGAGAGSAEDYDVWGGMSAGAGQDTGAIFVPVDTGHHAEFGTTSPNGGLQQWVSCSFGFGDGWSDVRELC